MRELFEKYMTIIAEFLPCYITIAIDCGSILNEQIVPELARKDRFFDVFTFGKKEASKQA